MNTTEELKELINKGLYQDNLGSLIQHCFSAARSFFKHLNHLFMYPAIACKGLFAIYAVLFTFKITHLSTGFLNNYRCSSNIPWMEFALPEPIKPAGCNIAKVYGCCPWPP